MIDGFLQKWLKRLQTFKRLYVGFSGGLDSTVLLYLLAHHRNSLPPIEAIHVHHGLSENATFWQMHCKNLCNTMEIPYIVDRVDFDRNSNIEEGARLARHAVFLKHLSQDEALLLGHHADDQAETMLLQLLRGAGVDGLCAMADIMPFGQGTLIRPLLDFTRKELEIFAHKTGCSWIEDESNLDEKYTRNFIRKSVIPMLNLRWSGTVKKLTGSAKVFQDTKSCLDDLARMDIGSPFSKDLPLNNLIHLDKARVINVLRYWFKNNHIRIPSTIILQNIFHEVIHAGSDANPEMVFADVIIRRYRNTLYLDKKELSVPNVGSLMWNDFPNPLDGGELGIFSMHGDLNPLLQHRIEIRFRKGGETIFWHRQHKSLKKLFQAWGIPPWRRDRIPLIFMDEKLIIVVDFAIGDGIEAYIKRTCPDTGRLF